MAKLGDKDVVIIHAIELAEIIDKELGKEKVLHPLVPLTRNIVEMLAEYQMKAQKYLSKVRKDLELSGVSAKIILHTGQPHKVAIKITEREGCSIIVLNCSDLTPDLEAIIKYSKI